MMNAQDRSAAILTAIFGGLSLTDTDARRERADMIRDEADKLWDVSQALFKLADELWDQSCR